jgi:hypothetical protein
MIKKITLGIVFFMVMSVSVYSQDIITGRFELIPDVSMEVFNKIGSTPGFGDDESFSPVERLPNSVKNEIDRQLTDYRPLINGQVFYWGGGLMFNAHSGQGYRVLLRVTDARKSQWEYYACMKTFHD